MVYIIPDFLILHFIENFMKMWTKIAKLQLHENLHKNVNENMFSFTFLCKFSWVFKKAILKATNILHCKFLVWFLIHLKWLYQYQLYFQASYAASAIGYLTGR